MEKGKPQYLLHSMSQLYSVHHKSHVDLSGIKPGPLWQQANDYCLTVVVTLQMSIIIELNWTEFTFYDSETVSISVKLKAAIPKGAPWSFEHIQVRDGTAHWNIPQQIPLLYPLGIHNHLSTLIKACYGAKITQLLYWPSNGLYNQGITVPFPGITEHLSLLQMVPPWTRAHAATYSPCTVDKMAGTRLKPYLHLLLRLWMCEGIPPLLHTPSWCVQCLHLY